MWKNIKKEEPPFNRDILIYFEYAGIDYIVCARRTNEQIISHCIYLDPVKYQHLITHWMLKPGKPHNK